MATVFLDSNATGANNGTSFADAFTSIESLTALAAGDIVLAASNHSENLFSSLSPTPPLHTVAPALPIPIISVNTGTLLPTPGAALVFFQIRRISPNYIFVGFTFTLGANSLFSPATLTLPTTFLRCTFTKTSGALLNFSGAMHARFIECTMTIGGATVPFAIGQLAIVEMIRCTISGALSTNLFSLTGNGFAIINLRGVDMSGLTSISTPIALLSGRQLLGEAVDCRFPSGVEFFNTASGNIGYASGYSLALSGNASVTAPRLTSFRNSPYGNATTDTTRVRTGGASDGETSFSFRLTATASAGPVPGVAGVRSVPISVYVEAGAQDVTIEVAHDGVGDGTSGALLDSELYIEGVSPDDASPSFPAGGAFTTSPTGAAADLPTSAASWSGSGVGTTQSVTASISPAEAGYVTFDVVFAPVDRTGVAVNVDPKPVVS